MTSSALLSLIFLLSNFWWRPSLETSNFLFSFPERLLIIPMHPVRVSLFSPCLFSFIFSEFSSYICVCVCVRECVCVCACVRMLQSLLRVRKIFGGWVMSIKKHICNERSYLFMKKRKKIISVMSFNETNFRSHRCLHIWSKSSTSLDQVFLLHFGH